MWPFFGQLWPTIPKKTKKWHKMTRKDQEWPKIVFSSQDTHFDQNLSLKSNLHSKSIFQHPSSRYGLFFGSPSSANPRQLVTSEGQKWAKIDSNIKFEQKLGSFSVILGHFGSFSVILGHFGPFQVIFLGGQTCWTQNFQLFRKTEKMTDGLDCLFSWFAEKILGCEHQRRLPGG